MSAWLVKTRRAPSGHSRDARIYGHMTTAMHKLSTPPPPRLPELLKRGEWRRIFFPCSPRYDEPGKKTWADSYGKREQQTNRIFPHRAETQGSAVGRPEPFPFIAKTKPNWDFLAQHLPSPTIPRLTRRVVVSNLRGCMLHLSESVRCQV